MNKYLLPSALVLVLILLIGGVYFFKPKPKQAIRIGYLPITACLPYFIGADQGYFAKEGLEVTPVRFETSNQMMDAMVQGQVDVVTSGASAVTFTIEEKSPGQFKVFAVNTNGPQNPLNVLMVKKDSPITDVQGLKGKKIASFPGIQAVTLIKRYLKMHGVDPEKDVQIQEMKQDLHLQALESGQVDAILTYEPNATIGVEKQIAKRLVDDPISQASVDPYPTGVFAVSTAYMNKNPKATNRLVRAFDKAIEYANTNQAGARALLPKFTPIESAIAEKVPLSHFETVKTMDKANFQKFADIFYEEGVLKKQPQIEGILY